MTHRIAALLGAAALAAFAGGVHAETVKYMAMMNAASEAPPNPSAGKGMADATFDTATKTLKWTVTYSGLTGAASMAHIHGPAAPGSNAPVIVPFANPASPISGQAVLTDAQASALAAGQLYVNVHTDANKGGEIRGQLMAMK